jgi:glutathione S-transferase
MSLILYYHPLASFCWKALIAFYENEVPFKPLLVDLGDENSRDDFYKVWPMGEFPVLRDEKNAQLIPQSSIIIEYLHLHHPGAVALIPADPDKALEARKWDRFFDGYVHEPMQKIVGNVIRPPGKNDFFGAEEAHDTLRTAYELLENHLKGKTWVAGDTFTIADCAACPALFYADKVEALGDTHPHLANYLGRLKERPSFARVLEEAKPYFHMFPYKK